MRNLLFLIALFLVLPLFAQDQSAPATDELTEHIRKKIQDNDKIHIDHLTITNQGNGTILLEGVADLFGSRYVAGEVASKIKGVTKVDNEIAVETKEVGDLDLEGELVNKIMRHIKSDPFNLVSIRVRHGFVELYGVVRDTTLIDDSFNEAIWIPGVRNVENKIEAASISQGDENLRQVVYQRLNTEWPQYFAQAHPAVIIIVKGGRVSLIGYVHSDVEKVKMASSIRSIRGVLSVENNLKTN
jgi:osmotically-inducible protein OsmY